MGIMGDETNPPRSPQFEKLTNLEAIVALYLYGSGTLRSIRGELNISRSRIPTLVAQVYAKLRTRDRQTFRQQYLRYLEWAGEPLPQTPCFTQPLTNKECEVLELYAVRWLSQKEVARSLWLSPNTIKSHIQTAYAKLGVGNRRDARAAYIRLCAERLHTKAQLTKWFRKVIADSQFQPHKRGRPFWVRSCGAH